MDIRAVYIRDNTNTYKARYIIVNSLSDIVAVRALVVVVVRIGKLTCKRLNRGLPGRKQGTVRI